MTVLPADIQLWFSLPAVYAAGLPKKREALERIYSHITELAQFILRELCCDDVHLLLLTQLRIASAELAKRLLTPEQWSSSSRYRTYVYCAVTDTPCLQQLTEIATRLWDAVTPYAMVCDIGVPIETLRGVLTLTELTILQSAENKIDNYHRHLSRVGS